MHCGIATLVDQEATAKGCRSGSRVMRDGQVKALLVNERESPM